MRRIYSIFGVPPEIQAYAMARYSRSAQSMLDSIQELSQQRAEQFLNTFYFEYGHRSIADMAHVVVALENLSILAAIRVVDEQLWDGQERSTRYQDFRKSGYYVPAEVLAEPEAGRCYRETAQALFDAYDRLSQQLLKALSEGVPKPDAMDAQHYQRTLRARAFDVTRSLLPVCTHTSLGQIVSARVLERQISRLLSDPMSEVREIGEELRRACQRPAETPLLGAQGGESKVPEPGSLAAAPTLVKYAVESPYLRRTPQLLAEAADQVLRPLGPPDRNHAVELAEPEPLDVELVATLLYSADSQGRSYRQIQARAAELPEAQRREIVALSVSERGDHEDLLRQHQSGYLLKFDLLIDIGSFRDLHRHRRCIQVQQPLTFRHGYQPLGEVLDLALGKEAARQAASSGLDRLLAQALEAARDSSTMVARLCPGLEHYLLPLAYRHRCLFKMDAAEAAYLIELRTRLGGHYSYRHVAWRMFQALSDRHPGLARHIRATDPHQVFDLLQR